VYVLCPGFVFKAKGMMTLDDDLMMI